MRLKRKIPTFIFGVSIGLIAGVAIFVFKLNDLFNKLKDSAKEEITVIEQPVKNIPEENEGRKKNKERFKIELKKNQPPKVNYKEVDSLIALDSRINIATEELLAVKNVKAINLGDNIAAKDTLAAKLAHVEENNSDLFSIEFWKTPLNSKGYRFSKNKIMLYGFIDFDNVSLYELDNSYYIKCSDQVYRLFNGGEFRQMERVVDPGLLAKIS